jgi:RimJ/RimL family protein N-acetyltransferase
MINDLLTGDLVRLAAVNADRDTETFLRWNLDTEYWRFSSLGPARPFTKNHEREFIKREFETDAPDIFAFEIRSRADDKLIGEIDLGGIRWAHGDTFVGIGIGERELWGKGYGTDAMRVILRFAFEELNLHRVSLSVYEYNPRAMRSYEKCGFQIEGRMRGMIQRDGKRYDMIYMGILQSEWRQTHQPQISRISQI